ncbi:hypothetical protein E6O75_ATG11068 [Venturia nashicola]|uniref:Uncharacterized protein n=1 Tax=Venturia nashicola TaxID=86259 RepID=A0A4Z1PK18_9PEZI|nr:hypothetical protein E6O75_ATG11068 [Venturia nashicola]
MLKSILEKAADRWHTALEPRIGVRFMQNWKEMCGPLDVAAVNVMYPDYIPPAGYHWDAVPPKPSSLQASKARPSVPAKPTSLLIH